MAPETLPLNPQHLQAAPYVEQWLGVWAMREQEFHGLSRLVQGMDLQVHLAGPGPQRARDAAADNRVAITGDGVALIELRGRMQKQQSSLGEAASTVAVRRAVRMAAADPAVGSILLVIDSPGGTVAGTAELAADVAAAKALKPVIALIEDIGASAAYWVASQATKVFAEPTAVVGSIGTYGVVYDASAAAAKDGIKVHVVRAGALKGAGTPGTEVTPEQLAALQDQVNSLNEFFLAGVSAGRNLPPEKVRELATGQVWIGGQAIATGLIDGVKNLDQTLAFASQLSTQKKGISRMAAATYAELVAACVGANPEFICEQLKAGASLDQSIMDWMTSQTLALEAQKKATADAVARGQADAAKAQADAAAAKALEKIPGVAALPAGGAKESAGDGNARAEFDAAIETKVRSGIPRPRAVAMSVSENPARHAAIIAAANEGRKVRS